MDLIKAKVLSLVNWCFNRESKSYLCASLKAGFFSNKKYDSYRCWSCAELCEAFTFLMENIYVQFDGMVYQQIVGIPMGTNCAPLIADLFLYCYERVRLRLSCCLTPYQRLRLYNGAPFSRLLRHARDTEDVFST